MKSGVERTDISPPHSAIPSSGTHRVRVRYSECDPMGVVYHGAYLPWLEIGRTELLRAAGASYAAMEQAGHFLVIVRVECVYKRPGRYDDLVEVRTRVARTSRVKILHEYEVWRIGEKHAHQETHDELLMTAETTLACVTGDGRPCELPGWLSGM